MLDYETHRASEYFRYTKRDFYFWSRQTHAPTSSSLTQRPNSSTTPQLYEFKNYRLENICIEIIIITDNNQLNSTFQITPILFVLYVECVW